MHLLLLESEAISDEPGLSRALEKIQQFSARDLVLGVPSLNRTEQNFLKAGERSARQDLVLGTTLAESARTFHMQLARQVTAEALWTETKKLLSELFEELLNFLTGLFLSAEMTPQGRRMLSSYGERAGVVILAQALRQAGHRARAVNSRSHFLTDCQNLSTDLRDRFLGEFRSEVSDLLKSGILPVIPRSLAPLIEND